MAAKTKHRIIGELLDVKMALDSTSVSRFLTIGNDWSKIRVALRLCAQDTGANIVGTPRLFAGVCSGTTNPWNNGAAVTTHAVGYLTVGATWTRSASPPHYVIDWGACKRVGTTLTAGSSIGTRLLQHTPEDGNRQLLFIDITKGSPNYTLLLWTKLISGAQDITQAQLLDQAIIESPSLTSHGAATQSLGVSGSDGDLDSVNLAWDRPTGLIEISDLVIVRFA
jgi:hypothetical protein